MSQRARIAFAIVLFVALVAGIFVESFLEVRRAEMDIPVARRHPIDNPPMLYGLEWM